MMVTVAAVSRCWCAVDGGDCRGGIAWMIRTAAATGGHQCASGRRRLDVYDGGGDQLELERLCPRRLPRRHRLEDFDGVDDRQVPGRLGTTAIATEVSPCRL